MAIASCMRGTCFGDLRGLTDESVMVPASAVAAMLGDLGWYDELPLPRTWTPKLIEMFGYWAEESNLPAPVVVGSDAVGEVSGGMVSAVGGGDIMRSLYEAWEMSDRGAVEPDTPAVATAVEVLYTLGYYEGPPLEAWSEEATIALGIWGKELETRPSVTPNVEMAWPAEGVLYVRFYPKGTWRALTNEYLTALKAVEMGTAPGVTVGPPVFIGEDVVEGASVEVEAAPEVKPPAAAEAAPVRYASMFGWGLLLVGIPVGLYYMFKGKRG